MNGNIKLYFYVVNPSILSGWRPCNCPEELRYVVRVRGGATWSLFSHARGDGLRGSCWNSCKLSHRLSDAVWIWKSEEGEKCPRTHGCRYCIHIFMLFILSFKSYSIIESRSIASAWLSAYTYWLQTHRHLRLDGQTDGWTLRSLLSACLAKATRSIRILTYSWLARKCYLDKGTMSIK